MEANEKNINKINKVFNEIRLICPKQLELSFDLCKVYNYQMDLSRSHTFSLEKSFKFKNFYVEILNQLDDKTEILKSLKIQIFEKFLELQKELKIDPTFDFYSYQHKDSFKINKQSLKQAKILLSDFKEKLYLKIVDPEEIIDEPFKKEPKIKINLILKIEKIEKVNLFLIYDLIFANEGISTSIYLTSTTNIPINDIIERFNQYSQNFYISNDESNLVNRVKFYISEDHLKFKFSNLVDLTFHSIIYITNSSDKVVDILNPEKMKKEITMINLKKFVQNLEKKNLNEGTKQLDLITFTSDEGGSDFQNITLSDNERQTLIKKEESLITDNEFEEINQEKSNLISKNNIKDLNELIKNFNSKHQLDFNKDKEGGFFKNFIEIKYEKLTSYSNFDNLKTEIHVPVIYFSLNNINKSVISLFKKQLEDKLLNRIIRIEGFYYSSNFISNILLKILRKIHKSVDPNFSNRYKVSIVKNILYRKLGSTLKKIKITNSLKYDVNDIDRYQIIFKKIQLLKKTLSKKSLERFNYNCEVHAKLLPCINLGDNFQYPPNIKLIKRLETPLITKKPQESLTNISKVKEIKVIVVIDLEIKKFLDIELVEILNLVLIKNEKLSILIIGDENEAKSLIYHVTSNNLFNLSQCEVIIFDNQPKKFEKRGILSDIFSLIYETNDIRYYFNQVQSDCCKNFNLFFLQNEKLIVKTNQLITVKAHLSNLYQYYISLRNRDSFLFIEFDRFIIKDLKTAFKNLCKLIGTFVFTKPCLFEFNIEIHHIFSNDFKEIISNRFIKPKLLFNFHEFDINNLNKFLRETIFNVLPQDEFLIESTIESVNPPVSISNIYCERCKTLRVSELTYICRFCKVYFCTQCGNDSHIHMLDFNYFIGTDKNTVLFGKFLGGLMKQKVEGNCCDCCKIF